jgi:hypothetical protein
VSAKGESTLASCTERGVASKEELLAVINMVMRNSQEFWLWTLPVYCRILRPPGVPMILCSLSKRQGASDGSIKINQVETYFRTGTDKGHLTG